ncbi:MAG: prolyl oligopeptidase family serine peptidase [Betaproteobacteria bacterium]|nr:prolyl oligopeptidase family serine peptidase [Betaproteobacteria bacterium]MDH3437886.1 prolyl oligopeptidase family serine peptidase [Betaproteobacteria bacterium]
MSRLQYIAAFALLIATGAGQAALAPGDHEFSVRHDGLRRTYLVYVPPQTAAGGRLPVILNFHGGGGNAKTQKWYSRMDETAAREGFVAVYPNGTGGFAGRFLTWNAGMCCGSAAARRVDDVGFILAVLDDLARRTRIDSTRVYATGLSNGSMMAYRLAAEASDRIAAVAGVAGAVTLPRFKSARPMPVMHIHSVDDERALYRGGLAPAFPWTNTRVLHPPVAAMLEKWLAHDGCPAKPDITATVKGHPGAADAAHTATRSTHGPCRAGTEVVLWKLTGAGHVWPGGQQDFLPLLLGSGTRVINANNEMWTFFARFRRE